MLQAQTVTRTNSETHNQQEIKYVVETDPTKSFTRISDENLIDSLGLIPQLMFSHEHANLSMWDALDANYQHGSGLHTETGTIGSDLSFNYPGDPPMPPLAKYTRGQEVAYQYKYGVMMIEKDGKLTPTRMD